MKTIEILEPFEGYPSGRRRAFTKGEIVEVPEAFADLVTSETKKHAKEVPAAPAPKKDKN